MSGTEHRRRNGASLLCTTLKGNAALQKNG